MQASDIPTRFPLAFGSSAGVGFIRTIPTLSQIGIQNGAASLTDGFPPLCFLPVGSGGIPPFGQDMNGILNQATAWSRWQSAGGLTTYNSAFSTAVGGYPTGAVVASTTAGRVWLCTADNNTTDPDSGGAANWVAFQVGTTGASTQLAPKLINLKANGQALGTVIPASVATRVQFTTTTSSNLGTNTWTGSRLTIGAGQGGDYDVASSIHFPAIGSSYYGQISIYRNGVQVSSGTTTQATSGTAQYLSMSAPIDLAVGDYLEIFAYQQSSGSLSVQADSSTFISATLIAAL